MKKIPLMKVGPKFNIVSFKTNPKSYCEIFPLAFSLTLDPKNLVIPAVRILIAAEAKEESTLQHKIENYLSKSSKLYSLLRMQKS